MSEQQTKMPDASLPITIHAQYIKDLSFENPRPIEAFSHAHNEQPHIAVSVQAKAERLGGRNFEVILNVRIDTKREEKPLFMAELSYGSVVTLGNQVKEEEVGFLLMVEVPKLIFPFARTLLADMSRDGGFPPLMLVPIDFKTLYEQQKKTVKAQKTNLKVETAEEKEKREKSLQMQIEYIAQESTKSIH